MAKNFAKEFANLIDHNIPRTFIQTPDAGKSDIPAECPALEADGLPKPPADGFIATYCCEGGRQQ